MRKLIVWRHVCQNWFIPKRYSFSENRIFRRILWTLYHTREHDIHERNDFDVPHAYKCLLTLRAVALEKAFDTLCVIELISKRRALYVPLVVHSRLYLLMRRATLAPIFYKPLEARIFARGLQRNFYRTPSREREREIIYTCSRWYSRHCVKYDSAYDSMRFGRKHLATLDI